jgi:hypothetical protein
MYSVAKKNGRGEQGLWRVSGMGTREHRVAKGRKPKAKHQGKEVGKKKMASGTGKATQRNTPTK